jgi:hypothetical protein
MTFPLDCVARLRRSPERRTPTDGFRFYELVEFLGLISFSSGVSSGAVLLRDGST